MQSQPGQKDSCTQFFSLLRRSNVARLLGVMVSLPSWMQGKKKEKGPKSMWKFHYMQEIWQDREISLDVSKPQLKTSNGEFEIDSINSLKTQKEITESEGFLSSLTCG